MHDIHLAEAGDGPTLLCLHGIGSSSVSFEPQLAGLAGAMRVVAWDAPGYGKSADPAGPPGLDGYADAAARVARKLAGGGPVHVLGVSWGGVSAARLALRHPEVVKSLLVADSSRGSGRVPEQAEAMRRRGAELAELGPEEFARRLAPRLLSPSAPAELVTRVAETMAEAIRLPGYGYAAQSMAETDLSPELDRVTAPTLVLCGAEDRVTGLEESQALAGGIPDAVYVVLEGAGHLANQEKPEAFNAWVESYVQIIERLYR